MLVVHIQIHVKSESIAEFIKATVENAGASIQEPGIARFDFVQQQDDPSRFVLVEAYRSTDAVTAHRATPHYAKWRDTVEPMMADPRQRTLFNALAPAPENW